MSDPLNKEELAALPVDELFERLKGRKDLPRHVAIIMDGNGRWARKRFLPRVAGHRAGRHSVRRCVQACGRLGIEYLTLYTFSQENFNRPEAEVKALMHFLQETLVGEREDLRRQNVRLVASGDLDQLPAPAREGLLMVIDHLKDNTGLCLNLALAYGGRQEILRAARLAARRVQEGQISWEDIDAEEFARGLYSPEVPDPDLLIRTSGEGRLSNFLLWQSAYAEFLITPVLWPDFQEKDLLLSVVDYLGRERRFGGVTPNPTPAAGEQDSDPTTRWKRILKELL